MSHDDRVFARNFSVLIAALAIFGVAMAILGVAIESKVGEPRDTGQVAGRIAPVGEVNTEPVEETSDGQAAAPQGEQVAAAGEQDAGGGAGRGKEVYDSACFVCHATPAVGAPVLGKEDDWAARIDKGLATLYENAINGYQGENGLMPAKGGRPDLSDEDVKAAVRFMVGESGGADVVEEAAGGDAAGGGSSDAGAGDAGAGTAAAAEQDGSDSLAMGKETYDSACFICHASGAAGAPKLGDEEAWAARLDKGMATLNDHAINGYMGESGLMPPKGGRADLSDKQVEAAVAYMVDSVE